MPIDAKKQWPRRYFGAKLQLLSCKSTLGPETFENYKKSLLETWPHVYKDLSDDEFHEKHFEYEEHKKKFLGWCKPGEFVYTRKFKSESYQNRLWVYINENDTTTYDYELVLVSIRKLPFYKEIGIECEIYHSTRVYHDNVPGQYHSGQFHEGTYSVEFNINNNLEFSLFETRWKNGKQATFKVID